MKILPFEKYSIESIKSIDEICLLIDKNSEPYKFHFFRNSIPKPLVGERDGEEFELRRYIQGRNSLLPIASGKLSNYNGSTKIEISLEPHLAVIIFMVFWLFFVALFFIAFLSFSMFEASLIPLSMFIFACILMHFGFWLEVPKLKNLILRAIENG